MNYALDKWDPTAYSPETGTAVNEGDFAENFNAAVMGFTRLDASQSQDAIRHDIWSEAIATINEITGSDFFSPASYLNIGVGISATQGHPEEMYRWKAEQIFDHVRKNADLLPEEITSMNFESIDLRTIDMAEQAQKELADITKTSTSFSNQAARFFGMIAGAGTDPAMVPFLFAGGGPGTVLKVAFREAVIGAGATAFVQPAVADWYKELGYDYTWRDFRNNVTAGAVGGAAFGVALKGAGAGIRLTNKQMKKGIKVLSDNVNGVDARTRALIDLLDSVDDLNFTNPGRDLLIHQTRLAEAERAIGNGEMPKLTPLTPDDVRPEVYEGSADNIGGIVFKFDPDKIGVDAETFQYKSGGDEFGVTEALRKETVWDIQQAGTITVYEYADGRLVIADGHQRLGLARRIKKQDPSQDVFLIGYKIKETDGITPAEARVNAALINIKLGTGSLIDAAKVFRDAPERMHEIKKNSDHIRQAKDLSYLTPDAFGSIVNEVIVERYGSIIGRILRDKPELQQSAIAIVQKSAPENVFQVEAIVTQIRNADFEEIKQISLFGEESNIESLFPQRAKILDESIKLLRKDKAAFETITRNSEKLEAAGNQLAKDVNERMAQTDAQAIEIIKANANRKGALSDALSAAARDAKSTGSYAKSVRNFVESIRRAMESNELSIIDAGRIEYSVDTPSTSSRSEITREPLTEGFDDPYGDAVNQQTDQLALDTLGAPEAEAPAQVAPTVLYSDTIKKDVRLGMEFGFQDQVDLGAKGNIGGISVIQDQVGREAAYFDGVDAALSGSDSPPTQVTREQTVIAEFAFAKAKAEADQWASMEPAPPPARRNDIAVTPEQAAMNDALQQVKSQLEPDWRPYMNMEEGDTLVPLANIVPVKVRPKGVVKSLEFMVQAGNNEIPKRGSLLLRDNGDGTFSIRDGNSTYAIADAAGWTDMPGKIITEEQYNTELSRKAADRILNQDALGKDKLRYVVAEDLGVNETKVFVAKLKDRQPFDNPDDLLTVAAINHDALNNAAQQAADDIGIEFERAPLKKREKVVEKVTNKYDGNYRQLADAARTGITPKTFAETDAFVQALSKKFHLVDEGWSLTSAGYFDRKLIVIFDDKSLGEIQIWPPKMLDAKSVRVKSAHKSLPDNAYDLKIGTDTETPGWSGHDYYDLSNKRSMDPEMVSEAVTRMKELYGSVQAQLDPSFAQNIGLGAPNAESTSATLASGISREPSSDTTASASFAEPPAGFQPSGPPQIMPTSSDMAATLLKSNSKNLMGPPLSSNIDIALPRVKTELTAAGEQMIIPGAERISDRALAERTMDKPMTGGRSAMPEGGLFDDVRTGDLFDDMDMEIPFGTIMDESNQTVSQTLTVREIKRMVDSEDALIKRLGVCSI